MRRIILTTFSVSTLLFFGRVDSLAQSSAELSGVQTSQVQVKEGVNRFISLLRPILVELKKLGATPEDITLIQESFFELQKLNEVEIDGIIVSLEAAIQSSNFELTLENMGQVLDGQELVLQTLEQIFDRLKIREQKLNVAALAKELRHRQSLNNYRTENLRSNKDNHQSVEAEQNAIKKSVDDLVQQISKLQEDTGFNDPRKNRIEQGFLAKLTEKAEQAAQAIAEEKYFEAERAQLPLEEMLASIAADINGDSISKELLIDLIAKLEGLKMRQQVLLDRGGHLTKAYDEQDAIARETHSLIVPVQDINAASGFQVKAAKVAMRRALGVPTSGNPSNFQSKAVEHLKVAIMRLESQLEKDFSEVNNGESSESSSDQNGESSESSDGQSDESGEQSSGKGGEGSQSAEGQSGSPGSESSGSSDQPGSGSEGGGSESSSAGDQSSGSSESTGEKSGQPREQSSGEGGEGSQSAEGQSGSPGSESSGSSGQPGSGSEGGGSESSSAGGQNGESSESSDDQSGESGEQSSGEGGEGSQSSEGQSDGPGSEGSESSGQPGSGSEGGGSEPAGGGGQSSEASESSGGQSEPKMAQSGRISQLPGGPVSGPGQGGAAGSTVSGDSLAALAEMYQKSNYLLDQQSGQGLSGFSAKEQIAIARQTAQLQSDLLSESPIAARQLGRAAARMAEMLDPQYASFEHIRKQAEVLDLLKQASQTILKEGQFRWSEKDAMIPGENVESPVIYSYSGDEELEDDLLGQPNISPADRSAIEAARDEAVSPEYAPLVESYYEKLSRLNEKSVDD